MSYEFFAWDPAAERERGASTGFRWGVSTPPSETDSSRSIHDALVATLVAEGWEVEGNGSGWYATRLRRRRPGVEDPRDRSEPLERAKGQPSPFGDGANGPEPMPAESWAEPVEAIHVPGASVREPS